MADKILKPGDVFRIRRMQIGGYRYFMDYDEGHYIHVRTLEGPERFGTYKVTTRGEDGKHLGQGGGWTGDSVLYLHPSDLEPIEQKK
ncbi:MAG: hypothetical protein HY518_03750 [Candidatus Aenigmarchaeota archaeon]|nr:hypothetical protein [Candidatus Aenigmarchaeota archaeon]